MSGGVQVSSTGSGSDQPHLLALLRAIRLRTAAPEAVEVGAADAAAALAAEDLERTRAAEAGAPEAHSAPANPQNLVHPNWPPATTAPDPSPQPPSPQPPSPQPVSESPAAVESPAAAPVSLPVATSGGGFHRLTGFPIMSGPADPTPTTSRGAVTPASPSPQDAPAPAGRPTDHGTRPFPYGRPAGSVPGLTAMTPVTGLDPIDNIPGGPVIPYIANPMPGEPLLPVRATAPAARENSVRENEAVVALPGDGMDPADAAAQHEMQRLLSNSLSLAGGPQEVAARLRAALLQAQPQVLDALPGGPVVQRDQLAAALTWLVHNLDDPPALAAGCAQLGAALAEAGVRPQQPQLLGAALAEAMRAGMAGGQLRQEFDLAWRETWQRVHEWLEHGAQMTGYQPTRWTAVVVSHDLRRPDLAVVRLRPYLPMPFRPGQYARIEVAALPGTWRPYSLAGSPRRDNLVELHVRAKTTTGVSGTLVHHTRVGDTVRLARAEGAMGLPDEPVRDLLMIAGDTGVAPLKALLTELAVTGDPRSVVLFWGVRNLDELYDIDEIAQIAHACERATVVPVISEGNPGPYASGLVTDAVAAYGEWSGHEVYLAGPPPMLAATDAALRLLGVDPARIHHDSP
ncbi:MAG: hypothetical protein QOH97_3893 [Actinoplanes sp.]|nr:hypothetical protein [Actinoplanes sp.]